MTIFSFEKEESIDITADQVDSGPGGMGISVDNGLKPGFIVMLDEAGKFKKGKIAWISSGEDGASCRAGIAYVPRFEKPGNDPATNTEQRFTLPECRHPGFVTSILVDVVEREEGSYKRRGY